MEELLPVLQHSLLFRGMTEQDITSILNCLSGERRTYGKNATILHCGDCATRIGLVLSGRVEIAREDCWGNRNILAVLEAGDCFAESYACVPHVLLGVDVVAQGSVTVLFLDVQRVLALCPSACAYHTRLIRNLLELIAAKNLALSEKLEHISQRSTREKLLSYLSAQAQKQGAQEFAIPLNRQQLADYLSVDRSAMSAALCKMRDEGLLKFERNRFTLLA